MAQASAPLISAVREHSLVCQELLALSLRESEALKASIPFSAGALQTERQRLLARLNASIRSLVGSRSGSAALRGDGILAELIKEVMDTIMRVLVIDRENEQQLLRRGLLPARALPPARQSEPGFVARTYLAHAHNS